MTRTFDLPDVLSLFPLPGALLLPRARLPLHIFEPRYLAMIEDCMKTPHRLIGMVQPIETAQGGLHRIGCAGRLTGFSETEDGRYMITLTGISRYRVGEIVEGFTPYTRAEVDWTGFDADRGPAETDPGFDRDSFMSLLGRFFARNDLSTDWDSLKQAEDELLINSMAMLAPFSPEDKQALLEAPRLGSRRETLMALIEFALYSDGSAEEKRQ